MIITKTPLRISFLGGGTDYPEYFEKNGSGAVLGTAVWSFTYLSCTNFHSRLFDYSIRIAYREVECVKQLDDIQHRPFRECLRWCDIKRDIEVNCTAELPSFCGLGSSSTFVVGLLNALYAYQGRSVGAMDLAYQAIRLEREVLHESVGCQDQMFAAVGGFNVIEFRTTNDIIVHRIPWVPERLEEFQDHLLVFFTGLRRRAEEIAAKQVRKINHNRAHLLRMRRMVDEGYSILTGSGNFSKFGELLHEGWWLKRNLDESISNNTIDKIYEEGRLAGALGGKLLGAGGGGFILFFVPPEKRDNVRRQLKYLEEIPIKLNAPGSHIIHS
jgi:D-glycero-alpha-D-manno-heptose-7-phosphate kinase